MSYKHLFKITTGICLLIIAVFLLYKFNSQTSHQRNKEKSKHIFYNALNQPINSAKPSDELCELGRQKIIEKDYYSALDILSQSIEEDQNALAYTLKAATYFKMFQNKNADEELNKALQIDADNDYVIYIHGLFRAYKLDKNCINDFTILIDRYPSESELYYRRGMFYRYLGENKLAAKDLLMAANKDKNGEIRKLAKIFLSD
jgi:tetratricopeptide (TPR) repeat protein